jgi:hypothetical protein
MVALITVSLALLHNGKDSPDLLICYLIGFGVSDRGSVYVPTQRNHIEFAAADALVTSRLAGLRRQPLDLIQQRLNPIVALQLTETVVERVGGCVGVSVLKQQAGC